MIPVLALLLAIIVVGVPLAYLFGVDVMLQVRNFSSAAGLTRTAREPLGDGDGNVVYYPRVRRVRRSRDRLEFVLFPAAGLKVADYAEKAEEMAAFFHAAEVVVTPVGVGDRAEVTVNSRDSIPAKFGVRDLYGGDV